MQIAESSGGRRRIVAHVGSAHTEAELGILLERAREMLADPAQGAFDLGIEPAVPRARLDSQARTESPQGVLALARPLEPVPLEELFLSPPGLH